MIHKKKLLAIVLIVALSLFSTSIVLADAHEGMNQSTEDKALVLFDLGLFLGTNVEVFTPNLGGATDRVAAMVMVARALNWVNAEDYDQDAVSGFADVPAWGEAYVAYAVQQGITVGMSETRFGYADPVTERQLQTWFDRALGKGNAWETWEANDNLDNTARLIRSDLVDHTWDALMAIPVGGTETLIETIVGNHQTRWNIALGGGLIPTSDVEIVASNYQVTNDDVAQDFYRPGDMFEVTLRGLEPETEITLALYIHVGGGGFPYYTDGVLVGHEGAFTGFVMPDGTFTISGEIGPDVPEGGIVLIPSAYGYNIDSPLSLMRGDHAIMIDFDYELEETE